MTNTPLHIEWWMSDLPNPGPYYASTMMNVVAAALDVRTEEERLVILRKSDFDRLVEPK